MYLCKLNNYCHELALKQPCAYVHITSINKVISTKTGAYYIANTAVITLHGMLSCDQSCLCTIDSIITLLYIYVYTDHDQTIENRRNH